MIKMPEKSAIIEGRYPMCLIAEGRSSTKERKIITPAESPSEKLSDFFPIFCNERANNAPTTVEIPAILVRMRGGTRGDILMVGYEHET